MYEARSKLYTTIIFKLIWFLSEHFQVKNAIKKYYLINVLPLKAVPFQVSLICSLFLTLVSFFYQEKANAYFGTI